MTWHVYKSDKKKTNKYDVFNATFYRGKKISLKRKTVIMCLPMNLVMLCSAWENKLYSCTGGIIWEVEGRGSGSSSKGVAYHTDSPTQVEEVFDLGWWVCMICYPLTTTPPTFHLPNNTTCVFMQAIQIHVYVYKDFHPTPGTLPPSPAAPLNIHTPLVIFLKCTDEENG